MKTIKTSLLILSAVLLSTPVYAIDITQVRFSWKVRADHAPVDRILSDRPIDVVSLPIYASFTISGTDIDFQEMKQNGYLEVRLEFWVDGRLVASPQVGITPSLWLRDSAGLNQELLERDFWDWRTLGLISAPLGTKLEVRVRDGNGVLLSPSGWTRGPYTPSILLNKVRHE